TSVPELIQAIGVTLLSWTPKLARPPCPAEGCPHGTTTPMYRGVPPRRREPGPRYWTNDPGCRQAARPRRTTARQLGQKRTPPAHLHRQRPTVTGGDSS